MKSLVINTAKPKLPPQKILFLVIGSRTLINQVNIKLISTVIISKVSNDELSYDKPVQVIKSEQNQKNNPYPCPYFQKQARTGFNWHVG